MGYKNTEKAYNATKIWKIKNKDKDRATTKTWRLANADKVRATRRAWQHTNSAKMNAKNAKRRAKKLAATPKWLTVENWNEIMEFYILAQELAWLNQDGMAFHVDHIIPLQGVEVCGLHVPWNLQLLPARDNKVKGNRR